MISYTNGEKFAYSGKKLILRETGDKQRYVYMSKDSLTDPIKNPFSTNVIEIETVGMDEIELMIENVDSGQGYWRTTLIICKSGSIVNGKSMLGPDEASYENYTICSDTGKLQFIADDYETEFEYLDLGENEIKAGMMEFVSKKVIKEPFFSGHAMGNVNILKDKKTKECLVLEIGFLYQQKSLRYWKETCLELIEKLSGIPAQKKIIKK